MLRSENQRAEDQQVQGALQQFQAVVGFLGRHATQECFFSGKMSTSKETTGSTNSSRFKVQVLSMWRRLDRHKAVHLRSSRPFVFGDRLQARCVITRSLQPPCSFSFFHT